MNEPDVLQRAAKALRAAHTGERQGSGFTRARIMTTLHGKRRRQLLRWAVFSPLASLVLVGSAWAHSTGKWPVVWQAVKSVLVAAPAADDTSPPLQRAADPAAVPPRPLETPEPATPELAPPEQPPSAPDPAQPIADPLPPVSLRTLDDEQPPPASTRRAAPPRPLRQRPGPSIEEPTRSPEPSEARAPADPELSKFRRAHDLHFRADSPREAIAAYAAYLEEFPNGRFVPEARYNTALNWIRLGDKPAARSALAPFAEGAHGNYRRTEARQLLEALK